MAASLAWGGFKNGRIPAAFLKTVRGELFEAEAAEHLLALEAAFEAFFGYECPILEGYRPYTRQQYLWDGWKARLPGFHLAAYPGSSNHGFARSADFAGGVDQYGSRQKQWMDANAPRFGWRPTGNSFTPKEAWHYDYIPGTATASLDYSYLEDDMPTVAEVVDGLLNHTAYDNGPTVSEVLKALFEGVFVGGTSMPAGKSIATLLAEAVEAATSAANATTADAVRANISAELNFPAYDGGPSVSQVYKNLDTRQAAPATGEPVVGGPALTEEQLAAVVEKVIRSLKFGATS